VKDNNDPEDVISLDRERGAKFLKKLAEEPFIALVVSSEGELQIFTKGIEEDHLARIRTVLREIIEEG
jgi:hypothetical protein